MAGVVQDMVFFDLGLDYLERFPRLVDALTRDAVNGAAARHLPRFQDTVRVVAGPARGATS